MLKKYLLLVFATIALLNNGQLNSMAQNSQSFVLENIGPIAFRDGTIGLHLRFKSSAELADAGSLNNVETRDLLNGHLEALCFIHGPKSLALARERFAGMTFKVFAVDLVWKDKSIKIGDRGWRAAFKINGDQCGERISK